MQTHLLDDFLCLAQTRSFSQAACLRHVTQPAFSRRIQALEHWAGSALVDRSRSPLRLTQAGRILLDQAPVILGNLQAARSRMREAPGRPALSMDGPRRGCPPMGDLAPERGRGAGLETRPAVRESGSDGFVAACRA